MKKPVILALGVFLISIGSVFPKDHVIPEEDAIRPPPFGIGIWYFGQDQEYAITGLRASMFGYPVPGFGPDAITRIENRVDQFNLKGDWWVLPWLNAHVVLGHASGEASASVNPMLPLPLGNFDVGYDAFIYGGGLTVAAGHGSFFASLTADYTRARVDYDDRDGLVLADASGIGTLVITPKVGWHGRRGAVWIGAFYQHTEHTQKGSFDIPGLGIVDFAADVEDKTSWNALVGGEYHFNGQWSACMEVGFGRDKRQAMLGVTRRF